MRDINKYSNNVMARHLYLTLGAAAGGAPATPDKASRAIRQWLAGKGLSFPELVLENGSGLSRIERISARNLGQLLLAAFRSASMPELMASLPVAAVDGTMRKRLAGAELAGQAHIKTGSLTGRARDRRLRARREGPAHGGRDDRQPRQRRQRAARSGRAAQVGLQPRLNAGNGTNVNMSRSDQ